MKKSELKSIIRECIIEVITDKKTAKTKKKADKRIFTLWVKPTYGKGYKVVDVIGLVKTDLNLINMALPKKHFPHQQEKKFFS